MTLRTSGWLRLLAMLAFAAIVLASCGGDDDGDATNGDSEQSEGLTCQWVPKKSK